MDLSLDNIDIFIEIPLLFILVSIELIQYIELLLTLYHLFIMFLSMI